MTLRRTVLSLLSILLLDRARPLVAQAGAPLGPEFRVNSYTTSYQILPSVASDSSGNFVVAWRSNGQDGSGRGVFGQRYSSSGAPAGSEFLVNTYTTSYQERPSVASDSSGNFVVVWDSATEDGSGRGIFGQRYAASGTPLGVEFRVNTFTTGEQRGPSVASSPTGDFVVVWASDTQDGSGYGVFGQRYASTGAPLGPEFRVNTYTTGAQGLPRVASDSTGNFVVVWADATEDGSGYGIFGQRYASSGAALGAEFRVNTFTTGSQLGPGLSSDSSGNFVVAWHEQTGLDGDGSGVFGQRYASSGAPLGTEFQVNTYTTGFQLFPSLASDSSGNFVIVWHSDLQDGSSVGVFGQRYSSSGAPAGPEFRVNSYTTGIQESASVASDSSGNFVVAWSSNNQDGSSYGVFAQRYGEIVPVELMKLSVE